VDRSRIAIVIPALNEAQTIGEIVRLASVFGRPVVVDDGSTDETAARAADAGASVVVHPVNRGYDGALNSGFARAAEIGCEYVVTMDADGQHDQKTLEPFIQALDTGADVVVGIRDRRARLAEVLFDWISAARWRLRDPLCGMKAYRIGVWRELGHFDSYTSIGTELALFAAATGKRIVQLPVPTRERAGAPRFGRRLSANARILRALWLGLRHWTGRPANTARVDGSLSA
jgi:glycosyltransferase involved in cell wall biosynthesis